MPYTWGRIHVSVHISLLQLQERFIFPKINQALDTHTHTHKKKKKTQPSRQACQGAIGTALTVTSVFKILNCERNLPCKHRIRKNHFQEANPSQKHSTKLTKKKIARHAYSERSGKYKYALTMPSHMLRHRAKKK
jgi:hypothetical protein